MMHFITPLNEQEKTRFNSLTLHELSILMQVAKGATPTDIAAKHFKTRGTIQRHIYAVRTKLKVDTNVGAVLMYQRARYDLDLAQMLPKASSRIVKQLRKYTPIVRRDGNHFIEINAKMLCQKAKVNPSTLPDTLNFLSFYHVLDWEREDNHRISVVLNKSFLPLTAFPMPDWNMFEREHLDKEAA